MYIISAILKSMTSTDKRKIKRKLLICLGFLLVLCIGIIIRIVISHRDTDTPVREDSQHNLQTTIKYQGYNVTTSE